jgi:triacylglycerol lipase
MPTFTQLYSWGLDYVYAGVQQVRSLTHRRIPDHFRDGDPELPAIVLLPGVYETWQFLEPTARRLNAEGYRIFTVPELAFNRMPIPRSAAIVAHTLQQLQIDHAVTRCVLLAHSKGGLIGKHLMLDEAEKHAAATDLTVQSPHTDIVGMVAIATPFSGSRYASFMLSRTLRAFSPRDAVVRALLQQLQVNAHIVSIYAEFDPHIPGGSALEGAHNIELAVSGHFRILASDLLHEAVEQEIAVMAGSSGDTSGGDTSGKDATHEPRER